MYRIVDAEMQWNILKINGTLYAILKLFLFLRLPPPLNHHHCTMACFVALRKARGVAYIHG
jgi:hypothetical protein